MGASILGFSHFPYNFLELIWLSEFIIEIKILVLNN